MDAEGYLAEISALRRKLESKSEALLILSQELNKCRTQRDQFKLISENIQAKLHTSSVNSSQDIGLGSDYGCYSCSTQLQQFKEKNKILVLQVEELKQKLYQAEGDIKAMRKEKQGEDRRVRAGNWAGGDEREALIRQAEEGVLRVRQLECDVHCLLDDKEELVSQRDRLYAKLHRLNHQLAAALSAPSGSSLDIDALVMENKYLQERLDQALTEKELSQQTLSKYKGMLDKKRNKGSVRLGTPTNSFGTVVTHKQVAELLAENGGRTEATLADLRSLCAALVDSLHDKTLALAHHKKTNKILADRINDLEKRLVKEGCFSVFPSRLLLQGYSSSTLDKDIHRLFDSDTNQEGEVKNDSPVDKIGDDLEDVEPAISDLKTLLLPVLDNNPTGGIGRVADDRNDTEVTKVAEEKPEAGIKLPPDLMLLVDKAIQELKLQQQDQQS